jgi:hypothetical protein
LKSIIMLARLLQDNNQEAIMTKALLGTVALAVAATLTTACGNGRDDDYGTRADAREESRPLAVNEAKTVVGCIKGGDERGSWVLAAQPEEMGASFQRSMQGVVASYAYVLEGEDLSQYVGREVSVTGVVDEREGIEVEKSREMEGEPTTTRDGDTVTPTVEIEEEAAIELRRMRVESVLTTGGTCELAETPVE